MSLARNDMLTTGNNRAPRARRSCYVDEPAFGFFVAGSTHKQMNGLYIRRNVPRPCPREHGIILYYEHMDSGWTMLLADCEAKPPPSAWGYERQAENAWFYRAVGRERVVLETKFRRHLLTITTGGVHEVWLRQSA